jgi:hypothetical protein
LEAIADFMRQHPWRSRDCVQKCARAVGVAIRCLHARLSVAVNAEGKPDAVLQAFARHLDEHLLVASDGGGIPGRFRLGAALPGWFTYKSPQGVVWEVQSPELECGVRGANDEGQNPKSEVEVQGSRFKVLNSSRSVPLPRWVTYLGSCASGSRWRSWLPAALVLGRYEEARP